MAENRILLTRRKAIRGAAALLGSSIAGAQITAFMSRAAVAAVEGEPPEFFDEDQFALIDRIADVMIPETDTPGASGVGVPHFIDLMLSEWASPARQARYVSGLAALDTELRGPGGEHFTELDADGQLEVLRGFDAAALADDGGNAFYAELKHMILFAYYSSEAGATEELQYQALPGVYQPCMPVDENTRGWFHLGFIHGL
jgi:gluconate 2-dehydrogenase gamma chain